MKTKISFIRRSSKNTLTAIFTVCVIFFISINLHSQPNFTLASESILTGSYCDDGAWGDYDNDGFLDHFASPGKLFHNKGDGTFELMEDHGIDADGWGYWIDYDNNGSLDLSAYSSSKSEFSIFSNNGNGTFSKIEINNAIVLNECSWADYDNDGYVDVVIFDYPGSALLYKNDGQGAFIEIEGFFNLSGDGEGGAWGDYNNDGLIDFFINDYGDENYLLKNNGDGSFTYITGVNVTSDKWSTGGCWVDFNNDGYLDMAVTTLEENSLYINNGDGTFTTVTDGDIVNTYSSTRNAAWGDYDNDGDLDYFVPNGRPLFNNNELYSNNGDGTFTTETNNVITDVVSGCHGPSWGDYDRDGDIDLSALSGYDNLSGGHFFINNGNGNNWINIKCTGIISNRSAIGTKVRVRAEIFGNDVWQLSLIAVPYSQQGQHSLNAEFGLGDATVIDTILVEWPSGIITVLTDISLNQYIEIDEIADQVVFYSHPTDQFICKGESIVLSAKAISPDPPISYQWQKNGEDIPGETTDTLVLNNVDLSHSGHYRCIAFDNSGSDTSNTAYAEVIEVAPTEIMGLTEVELFHLATYSFSYQPDHMYHFWVEGGNIIDSTLNSITVHWTTSGYGFVYLLETGEYGCQGDTVALQVTIQSLGIEELGFTGLILYPNPTSGIFNLQFSIYNLQRVTVKIYDLYGREVATVVERQFPAGEHIVSFDASGLQAGVYFCRAKIDKKTETIKIIKL